MLHGDAAPFLASADDSSAPRRRERTGRAKLSKGGRLFPKLDGTAIRMLPDADGQRSPTWTKEALDDITTCMVGPNDRESLPGALSSTPAAFTYFGQFVFHDIVFSRVFGLSPGLGQSHVVKNAVSFGLDLSGLYGRGPTIDGHLYATPTPDRPGTCHFPLGLPCARGTRQPVDPDVEHGRDLPRIDMGSGFINTDGRRSAYRPLIADPRNDDNLMLSQLVTTLMRIHNRVVNAQLNTGIRDANVAYFRAKIFLTDAYRQTVVHDYLKRLVDPRIWSLFFKPGGDFQGPMVSTLRSLGGIPAEFTFAASRFAHSMVRRSYRVNPEFDAEAGRLEELLTFSSLRDDGDVPVPVRWIVNWSRFVGDGPDVQHARRISPFLSPALTEARLNLTRDGGRARSVAFMDCWRCYDLGLPSGQAVAAEVGRIVNESPEVAQPFPVAVLAGNEMLPTAECTRRYPASAAALAAALQRAPEFLNETPLSYYMLQEAAAGPSDGNALGPVGSYVVAATLAASLFLSPDTEVRAGKVNRGRIRSLSAMFALLDMADDELMAQMN